MCALQAQQSGTVEIWREVGTCWIYMIICIYIYFLFRVWEAVAHLCWSYRWRSDPLVQDDMPSRLNSTPRPGKLHLNFSKTFCLLMYHSQPYYFHSNWFKLSNHTIKLKLSQNLPLMKIQKSFSCKLLIKTIPTVSRIYHGRMLDQKANSLTVLLLYFMITERLEMRAKLSYSLFNMKSPWFIFLQNW